MKTADISDTFVIQCGGRIGSHGLPSSLETLIALTGAPPKVALRAAERAASRNLIEYGTSINSYWARGPLSERYKDVAPAFKTQTYSAYEVPYVDRFLQSLHGPGVVRCWLYLHIDGSEMYAIVDAITAVTISLHLSLTSLYGSLLKVVDCTDAVPVAAE